MKRHMGVSGIVLAGGMSRRLGRNKALEDVGGQQLVLRVLERLSRVTDDIVIVVNEIERAEVLPVPQSAKVVVDLYPGTGALGGIFTGLSTCDRTWGLVVACDMPFLNVELLDYILAQRDGHDAVVPVLDGRPEPTHAAYSSECLQYIKVRLQANERKISGFFDSIRMEYVLQSQVERYDPEHLSFFNINTQMDLDRARDLALSDN